MTVDQKAVQRATNALVKALGIPQSHLTSITLHCGGTIRVHTRESADFAAGHFNGWRSTDA